jgi:acyl-coenzyme A synthetase/AMP-(fatty) acid ligase
VCIACCCCAQPGARYRNAYFVTADGSSSDVWRHGDYIEVTRRGGIVVHGRSDATLNPGGVRIGTAEVRVYFAYYYYYCYVKLMTCTAQLC